MKTEEYGIQFGQKKDYYLGIRKHDLGGIIVIEGPRLDPAIRISLSNPEFTAFLEAAEKVKKL